MSEEFTPRTVAVVALASLVGGFVAVFGGGMLWIRSRTEAAIAPDPAPAVRRPAPATDGAVPPSNALPLVDADAPVAPSVFDPTGDGDASAPPPSPSSVVDGGPAPVQAGGVTITPASVSRCFEIGSTVPIPAAGCDALPALDQHMLSKAADIAGCTHAHGRLSLLIDFRFSTSFARAWGGPSSTIADAGTVAQCVRRVTAPLPLASLTHAHDRYIVVYGIEW